LRFLVVGEQSAARNAQRATRSNPASNLRASRSRYSGGSVTPAAAGSGGAGNGSAAAHEPATADNGDIETVRVRAHIQRDIYGGIRPVHFAFGSFLRQHVCVA
jgi:hypothetical protein